LENPTERVLKAGSLSSYKEFTFTWYYLQSEVHMDMALDRTKDDIPSLLKPLRAALHLEASGGALY
jgi:hypothetical protein